MSERMTDERLAEIKNIIAQYNLEYSNEFLQALQAERGYATELETIGLDVCANFLKESATAESRIHELESQVKAQPDCTWILEDDWDNASWQGDCGATWNLDAGGPKENGMKFCPDCGGNLIEQALEVDDG